MFTKNLNFRCNLMIFRMILLLITFVSITYLQAQQVENPNQAEQATIVLKNGAKIFSTDEAFNKQINNQAVIIKNAEQTATNNKNVVLLEATPSKTQIPRKDLKQEVKKSAEKKQKEELKKIKKEIDRHEARKKAFLINNFSAPSSEEFIVLGRSNRDYVVPGYHHYDLSKAILTIYSNEVKSALDFLHSEKYTIYNNQSLDFCSEIFSVRPPPVLG